MTPDARAFGRLAWHCFTFALPGDWEITRYALPAADGRLEFSSRAGFEGQVSWRVCARRPDEGAMMTESHARYLRAKSPDQARGFAGLTLGQAGVFQTGVRAEREPFHASHFIEEESVVVQWTFPDSAAEKVRAVRTPLLKSFQPNRGAVREWSAFGLSLCLPAAYAPAEARVFPADVTLAFEAARSPQLRFHRWGLAPFLLKNTTLAEFYGRFLAAGGRRILRTAPTRFRDQPAAVIDFEERGERNMDRLVGRWWKGRGLAWHAEREMRIVAAEQVCPRKVSPLELADVFR